MPKTLFEKIWESHLVEKGNGDKPSIIYIDLHLIHEVTSPQPFDGLRKRGITVARPDKTYATEDHAIPTKNIDGIFEDQLAAKQVDALRANCLEFGIPLAQIGTAKQGIVHVIGPERGLTQPGMTIVCGDSHTSTHGAFGTLAFGIGTSEVEMVLASQCLLQDKAKTYEIRIEGELSKGVTAKDIILSIIQKIGVKGGIGYVFEYTGSTIRALSMEERMTICNMSVEAGAKAGMIAPDQITFDYLKDREFAPKAKDFDKAVQKWKDLVSDQEAKYDRSILIDACEVEPMITYGTNPEQAIKITEQIPYLSEIEQESDSVLFKRALDYMGFKEGQSLVGQKIDHIFIGSCTNARLSDLKVAAKILEGQKINSKIKTAIVVPGSASVKTEAEKLCLDQIFKEAGFEWRSSGCSACLAMNNDKMPSLEYVASTSNRNYENRQGRGARTILMSPIMVAAAALRGEITDVRDLI